jgi:CubicO group peptidase (beta-lactamase class C family)|eukprot:COSAG02_NODE_6730_length_3396_cov_25.147407_3_plen_195_part_00
MLIDRGLLSIEDPVVRYWPEFAAEGKETLTVGQLLSHQAGLMAVPSIPDAATPFAIMLGEDGWMNTVNALAAATPAWSPMEQLFEYHGMTFGHLAGELIRRVSGQPAVEFLRDNILQPLGVEADVLIGMDESDFARVAVLAEGDGSTDKGTAGTFNAPETRKAVIPSANGHTNGRALARIYSAVANVRFLCRTP